jgi:FkbM family methyltransferase
VKRSLPLILFPEDRQFLIELKKRDYRPSVVYDLGASTGIWSELVATVYPAAEVHMFEPLAAEIETYRTDLAERTARRPRLHLHPVALGRENASGQLHATHDAYGSSLLDRGDVPDVEGAITVPVRRLDEYRQEHGLPWPDIMKLDCQGAEIAIMDGASECLRHAKVLLLESWLVRTRAYGPGTPLIAEVTEYLTERGFACVDFGQRFHDEQQRLYSVDCFFIAEDSLEEIWLRPPVNQKIAELYQRITHLENEVADSGKQIAFLKAELEAFHEGHARAMADVHNSWSWRLTKPLRWLK